MKARVNNFLTTDPYNKRGQIGKVKEIKDDMATLIFEDGTTGQYQTDALEFDGLFDMKKYETQEAFDKLSQYQRRCGSFMYALIDAYFKATTGNRKAILKGFKEDFDVIINSEY